MNLQDIMIGTLTKDGMQYDFPAIIGTNAHGRETYWRISVRLQSKDAFVPIKKEYFDNMPMPPNIHGYMFVESHVKDGKTRSIVPTIIAEGKNKGRSNETNVFCQTLRVAHSKHNSQLKITVVGDLPPPMLAQVYKSAESEVYMQPKLNGVRVVAVLRGNEVILYSRSRRIFPGLNKIREELRGILEPFPGIYIDGEVYKHGVSLQTISGAARSAADNTIGLEYYVFDMFDTNQRDMLFSERYAILRDILRRPTSLVHLVQTELVQKEDVKAMYDKYIKAKYEGAMVRYDKPYDFAFNNRHSKYLLKIKPALDAEFEIVGYKSGDRGKAAASLMIICQTPQGKRFPVTPALTTAQREEMLKKMGEVDPVTGKSHFEENWLGKQIIIYFDEYSNAHVPLRARTKLEIRTWD